MKKGFSLMLINLFTLCCLNAQDQSILITGNFQNTPLIDFISELEHKFNLKFFFEEEVIDRIAVTQNFDKTALQECLERILKNHSVSFHIRDNQVILYSGFILSDLFSLKELDDKTNIIESAEKITRDRLLQQQYRILNIGSPVKSTSKTATVSGFLRTFEKGDPIIGGIISVKELGKVVTSNEKGYYQLTLPVGNHILNITCLGMEPVRRNINLYSDGRLNIEMILKINQLNAVEIEAFGKNFLGGMSGRSQINIQTMKSIPVILGEADIMKSILIIPGVQSVGEGTSGFNVRGGATDHNLVLIDQAPLYYTSHFFGNFSAINSEIVNNAILYKGYIPVRFGGRISSVLEINTVNGDDKKISGSTGISPISARINLGGPLAPEKSTFLTSFRSTYSNWLLNQMKVASLYKSKAGFYDFQLKLNLYLNKNNKLTADFYTSNDQFQLHSDTTYHYNNTIGSLLLKHSFNNKLDLNSSLVYSAYDYKIFNYNSSNTSFALTHSLAEIILKNYFEYFRNRHQKYIGGFDVNYYSINPGERNALDHSNISQVKASDDRAIEFGSYIGSEFNISARIKLEGGVRFSGLVSFNREKEYVYTASKPYSIDNISDTVSNPVNSIGRIYTNPEWRFAINYMTVGLSSYKLSYNKTAQYIHMLSNTTAISPTDVWKLSDKNLVPITAHQFSIGYFRSFRKEKLNISVESYYKIIDNIKVYKAGADLLLNDHIETEIVNGKAKSYGIELAVEKSGGKISGRFDYTWSRTFIRSVSRFKEELINDGEFFPANYDKPHNLNVLATFNASRRVIFNTDIVYSTGRPITYPVGKYQLGEGVFFQYSKYNQYRIPDYFRADLSLTIKGNLKINHLFHSSITISLYNLTGRKNAYSVYFQSKEGKWDAYRLSIFGTIIPNVTYNLVF